MEFSNTAWAIRSIRYAASLKAIANLIEWPHTIFYSDDIFYFSGVSIYEKPPLLSESFKMIQTDYLSSPEVSNWLLIFCLDLSKVTAFWPLSNF